MKRVITVLLTVFLYCARLLARAMDIFASSSRYYLPVRGGGVTIPPSRRRAIRRVRLRRRVPMLRGPPSGGVVACSLALLLALLPASVQAQIAISKVNGLQSALSRLANRGKCLYVDGTHGNNSTAVRGRVDRPYLTIAAAKAAASSGDTIYVRPGTYNEKNIGKTGVNIFGPNADVIYTGTSAGGIVDDSATNGTGGAISAVYHFRYIRLNSVHTGSPAGHNGAINIENGSSDVVVQAVDISCGITNGTSSQRSALYCNGGKLTVWCSRQISNSHYDAIIVGETTTCTVSVTCDEVFTTTTTGGDGVEWAHGNFYLKCRKMDTYGSVFNALYDTGTYTVVVDAMHIVGEALVTEGLFPNAGVFIRAVLIESRTQHPIEAEGGYPEIIGAKIRSAGNAEVVALIGGHVKLRDCTLIAHGTATEAITGTANLKVYGTLTANKAKAAGITVTVGAYPTPDTDVD